MLDEINELWPKNYIPIGEKRHLKPFLTNELADHISKCSIKQVTEILRQNEEEIVEVLVECYEKTSGGKMVDYVWDFITPASKFNDVKFQMVKLAESVEKNWSNIEHTKLSAAEEAKIDKLMARKRPGASDSEEEKQREPPPKRSVPCDPRPVDPAYVPPKSMFNDENYGRVGVAEKSNNKANSTGNPKDDNREKSPPSPQSAADKEVEENEESEPEADIHVAPQRPSNIYDKYSTRKPTRFSPPPTNNAIRDDCRKDEEAYSHDTVSMDQQERDIGDDSRSNDEKSDESEDEFPSLGPRNLDRYCRPATIIPPSASRVSPPPQNSPQPPPPPARSMLDDVSSSEEDDSNDRGRQTSIRFDKTTFYKNPLAGSVEDERPSRAALQTHDNLDFENKVDMQGPNPTQHLIAFPNQKGPCLKPAYEVLESWIPTTEYEDVIEDTFYGFRDVSRKQDAEGRFSKLPEHLFIFDSMLSGIPFEKTFKRISLIECAHPNNPFKITDYLVEEMKKKRNDYIIKNIFICVGLDLLTLDPEDKRARKNASDFFEKLLNLVKYSFDPRTGPKRYRCDVDKHVIQVVPPKMIFITIPQVKGRPGVNTLNKEIIKMNEHIQKFVGRCEKDAAQKGIVMELYDWSKAAEKFDECNEEHLRKRNDILMTHLSKEYAVLMM